jgi:tripartite-type tricarboxylate transporter receptor subunit TctC
MARHTRRAILKGGALAAAAIAAGPSRAQEFAPRQMRIVVSAAAGGATDAIARMLSTDKTFAYRYQGRRFDCGSKEGVVAATVHFARKAGYSV